MLSNLIINHLFDLISPIHSSASICYLLWKAFSQSPLPYLRDTWKSYPKPNYWSLTLIPNCLIWKLSPSHSWWQHDFFPVLQPKTLESCCLLFFSYSTSDLTGKAFDYTLKTFRIWLLPPLSKSLPSIT